MRHSSGFFFKNILSWIIPFSMILMVIALNIFIYWPALGHPAKGDQMIWLLEMADYDSWAEIWRQSYSYCRTRQFNTGDEILFRPLFYLWMSVQKDIFEYRFFLWQAVSLALHIGVFLMILKIVRRFSRDWLWIPAAGFFSVMFFYSEMVIWHHISGYLLAFLLILWAVDCLFAQLESRKINVWLIFVLLSVAGLIFEYACLAGIAMSCSLILAGACRGGSLSVVRKRHVLILAFGPVLFCGGLSLWDWFMHLETGGLQAFAGGRGLADTGINFIKFLYLYLIVPFFSFNWNIEPAERSFLHHPEWFRFVDHSLLRLLQISFLASLAGAIVCSLNAFFRRQLLWVRMEEKENCVRCVGKWLVFLLVLAYMAMIVFGRVDDATMLYLRYSLYHFYYLWFLTFILIAIVFSGMKFVPCVSRFLVRGALFLFLTIGMILNGMCVFSRNAALNDYYKSWSDCVSRIQDFVDQHKYENGFSFEIVANDRPLISDIFWGSPLDKRGVFLEYTEQFFGKYSHGAFSRYFLVYHENSGLRVFSHLSEVEEYLRGNPSDWFFRGSVIRKR